MNGPPGFEQLFVSATYAALASVPPRSAGVVVAVEKAPVRYTAYSTIPPSASVGVLLAIGDALRYDYDPTRLLFCAATAGATAVLQADYQ